MEAGVENAGSGYKISATRGMDNITLMASESERLSLERAIGTLSITGLIIEEKGYGLRVWGERPRINKLKELLKSGLSEELQCVYSKGPMNAITGGYAMRVSDLTLLSQKNNWY